MNRIEPNLLLAVSTGFALLLLLGSAVVYGAPGGEVRYPVLALVCAGLFVLLSGGLNKQLGWRSDPLIAPGAKGTLAVAGLFPLILMLAALWPAFQPGADYGLLIIIGSVWFGVTVLSAVRARRTT